MADKLRWYRRRVAELQKAIGIACGIIEVGDQRRLASDGPLAGQPPDITLDEWKRMYRVLNNTRRSSTTKAK